MDGFVVQEGIIGLKDQSTVSFAVKFHVAEYSGNFDTEFLSCHCIKGNPKHYF